MTLKYFVLNYRSGKINYATQQIIAGIKYRINADLFDVDNKVITCNVIIVKMVASSETEVTFKCPNLEDVTKIY